MVSLDDRAQLILIGALLIATVIFGLSFLVNSILFTGASSAGGAGPSVADTADTTREVQRSVRSLLVRLNHQSRNVTAGDVASKIESNVTRLGNLIGESKATTGAFAIQVTYDNDTSTRGYRIVQSHDDDFTDGSGLNDDWYPVPGSGFGSSPRASLGWFTVNVDVGATNATGDTFEVTARNDSLDSVSIELERNSGNISVTSTPPGGSPSSTICRGIQGRALLDLVDGSDFEGTCEFTGIGTLSGPKSIEFEDGDRIQGRYAIVLNQSTSHLGTSTYLECLDGSGNPRSPEFADPCVAPVIWSANVTTSIRGDRVSYRDATNLTVYPEGR